jgi:integrase
VRDAKGNKDRLVPLPETTLSVLRRFWLTHRNPHLLFPSRRQGLTGAATATSTLDRGTIQLALRRVVSDMGLKKTSRPTACATAMQLT